MLQEPFVDIQRQDGVMLARIQRTRVDFTSIDKIKQIVSSATNIAYQKPVVVDLSGVEMVPKLVMGAFVKMLKELESAGQRFILVGLEKHLRDSSGVTRIDHFFETHGTAEEAISALESSGWQC